MVKIINVMASSLDGAISRGQYEADENRWDFGFNCQEDRNLLARELRQADAIITGAQSVRASKTLTTVPDLEKQPDWFIYTQRGLEGNLPFWNQDNLNIKFISPRELKLAQSKKNISNLCYNDLNSAKFLYEHLHEASYKRVLLFGGGKINSLFYQNSLCEKLF